MAYWRHFNFTKKFKIKNMKTRRFRVITKKVGKKTFFEAQIKTRSIFPRWKAFIVSNNEGLMILNSINHHQMTFDDAYKNIDKFKDFYGEDKTIIEQLRYI
jgi:hypothetical protein